MKVLVTGGTGHLGRDVVALLRQDGHDVRVLARRPGNDPDVEWVHGDLATGEGIGSAVAGVQTVIHAATNSPAARRGSFTLGDLLRSPADVDVHGTSALLAAAEETGVERFVHVSIVGLEHLRRLPYSRRKLVAEALVRGSALDTSIVRATGFYWLLDRMFQRMLSQPVLTLPARAKMAPVASEDFARFVFECASDGRTGEREDFAGPQTLGMIELMQQFLEARGLDRRVRRAPVPQRIQTALTAANTSTCGRRGATTWMQWLQRDRGATRRELESGRGGRRLGSPAH